MVQGPHLERAHLVRRLTVKGERQVKLKRAAYRHIEAEIYAYHDTLLPGKTIVICYWPFLDKEIAFFEESLDLV